MKKIRIAIADDHELVRDGIKTILLSFRNYEVVCEASNGKELIESIEKLESKPNIALIDLTMPEMNGFDAIKYLAREYPKIKCIGISVNIDFNSVFSVIDNGGKAYIPKGSTRQFMKETIDEVFTKGDCYSSFVVDSLMEYKKNKNETLESRKYIPNINDFTPRQIEFIKIFCSDLVVKEIAEIKMVSPRSVETFREVIMKKLKCRTRVGIVLFAVDAGLYVPKGGS